MPAFEDLLAEGGGVARQLFVWGMLEQLVTALVEPLFRALEQDVNTKDPNDVLSPADLAQAVVRKVMDTEAAAAMAARSGLDAEKFTTLLHLAGEPPGLESVLAWYRRGIVEWGKAGPGEASVANAVATSRIYPYWSDAIKASNILPITPAVMVDARVENQTDLGTRDKFQAAAGGEQVEGLSPTATTFYQVMWHAGYSPVQADLMYRVRGNPPAPSELLELYRRGFIPMTGTGPDALTVQQGIAEGATRDKWFGPLSKLAVTIPSEYYIMEMVKEGAITPAFATAKLLELGYTETIAAGIVQVGSGGQVETYKKLTESIVTKMYEDRVLTRTKAAAMLGDIGFGPEAATYVLTVVDLALQTKEVDTAITRVGTLYRSRKITRTVAQSSLAVLGVTGTASQAIIKTWDLERSVTVKLLTESQIADAWKYLIMDQATATAALVNIGYTPHDAWVVLSDTNHGPLPTEPATGPAPVGPLPTGGL